MKKASIFIVAIAIAAGAYWLVTDTFHGNVQTHTAAELPIKCFTIEKNEVIFNRDTLGRPSGTPSAIPIAGVDPSSFRNLTPDSTQICWGADKNHVYYADHWNSSTAEIVKDADPKTFQILNAKYGIFAKDATHVYYGGAFIQKIVADASTFTVLDNFYAKDSQHVYAPADDITGDYTLVIVKGADPKTFIPPAHQ